MEEPSGGLKTVEWLSEEIWSESEQKVVWTIEPTPKLVLRTRKVVLSLHRKVVLSAFKKVVDGLAPTDLFYMKGNASSFNPTNLKQNKA